MSKTAFEHPKIKKNITLAKSISGVLVTNPEGRIEFINDAWANLLEQNAEELEKGHIIAIFEKEEFENNVIPLIKTARKKGFAIEEISQTKKDGEKFKSLIQIACARNNQGEVENLIWTAFAATSDVTHPNKQMIKTQLENNNVDLADLNSTYENAADLTKIQLEHLLESSEQQKAKDEAILSSIGEGVVVTDENRTIHMINKVAEELLGMPLQKAVGKKWPDIANPTDEDHNPMPKNEFVIEKALKTGKPEHNDKSNPYFINKGEKLKMAITETVSPVRMQDKIVGTIIVFRDITKEKEVDKMKSEFISLASHQLRTPLSAIKWFTEMLLSGDVGDLNLGQIEYINNIYNANKRMIELINSLLNISRIESGRIMIEPTETSLPQLFNTVYVEIRPQAEKKAQQISLKVAKDLPNINIDKKLIRNVYLNLLTNAIKYTPEQGQIAIELYVDQQKQAIVSKIKDTGFGIPQHEQHKIFNRFFRADNISKHVTEGTGLGLYLAKIIVESSGGKLWFESEVDKGSAFYFSLPLKGTEPKAGEITLA